MLCSNQARMVVLDRAEEILPTWVLWMQGVYTCLERECIEFMEWKSLEGH